MMDPLVALALRRVAAAMSEKLGQWRVDGDRVRGPGPVAIRTRHHHDAHRTHLDLGFALDDANDASVIWDCAGGHGDDPVNAVEHAVRMWADNTAVVMLELMTQRGEYAEHVSARDGLGIAGWHGLHGPVIGFGAGDGPDELQEWVLANPLLPALARELTAALRAPINGVKFLFGSSRGEDVAEVRINGEADDAASASLKAMDWPRFDEPAFVRCFVLLLIEREGTAAP